MGLSTQQKFTSFAIAALIILNLVLIGLIIAPKAFKSNDRPSPDKRGNLTELISKKLSFTSEQKEQLKALDSEHREKMSRLQPALNQKRRQLFDLVKKDGDQTEEVQKVSSEMGRIVSELEYTNFHFFSSIRSLCTEEQKTGFDVILKEIGNRRGAGPPQGQGPDGRGNRTGNRPEGSRPEN